MSIMKPDEKKEIKLFDRKTIVVLTISTILGFLIAFMFYKIADIKRKPTFLVNPLRSNIVNFERFASSAPDSIIVSIQNYIPEDLNVLTYYFFNQGKKPIKICKVTM